MTLDRVKLGKVLALLSSPIDGEALAAARTACRMLAAAGLRPEDLAQTMAAPAAAPQPRPPAASPQPFRRPDNLPRYQPRATVRDFTLPQLRALFTAVLALRPLRDTEMFIQGISQRLYAAPHLLPTTAEIRKLNKLWRVVELMER